MALRDHLDEIVLLRVNGASYQCIGDKFGVTRERVRQVLRQLPNGEFLTSGLNCQLRERLPRSLNAARRPCAACGTPILVCHGHFTCSHACRIVVRDRRRAERGRAIVEKRLAGLKWGEDGLLRNLRQAKVEVRAYEKATGGLPVEQAWVVFPLSGPET